MYKKVISIYTWYIYCIEFKIKLNKTNKQKAEVWMKQINGRDTL